MQLESNIDHFTTTLSEDPLLIYISKKEELFRKLIEDNDNIEFWKVIDKDTKYNTEETAGLVGKVRGQRVLNILNDKKRDFRSYVKPKKLGVKNVYDAYAVFRIKMIIFLSKERSLNDVADILGFSELNNLESVSSHSESLLLQKNGSYSFTDEGDINILKKFSRTAIEESKELLEIVEREIEEKSKQLQHEKNKVLLALEREYREQQLQVNEDYIAKIQQMNDEKNKLRTNYERKIKKFKQQLDS